MNHFTEDYRKELSKLSTSMEEVGYSEKDIELTKQTYSYSALMKELGVRIL
jgi:hypothetical protein